MAEEPNQVEADRGSQDADRIKQEIERTRANMSGTIDEIQDRLNPQNIVQQAKDSMRGATVDKVKGALSTASQAASRAAGQAQTTASRVASQAQTTARRAASQAKENPVPAALITSGLLWAMSRGMASRRDREYSRTRYNNRWSRRVGRDNDDMEYYESSSSSGLMGNRQAQGAFIAGVLGYYLMSRRSAAMRSSESSEYGSEFGSTGSSGWSADRLKRALAEPARGVGESARRVGESAKRAGRTAQEKAMQYAGRGKDVGQQVTRWVGENPLAVGAAVVALGTVVGLSMANDDYLYDDDDDWSQMSRRSNDMMGHGGDDFGRGVESDLDGPPNDVGPKAGPSGRTSRTSRM